MAHVRPQTPNLAAVYGALPSRGRWAAEGAALWRWNDTIDRRWMRLYQDLPAMAQPSNDPSRATADDPLAVLASTPMRCGGCGAKVGKDALARVLQRLAPKSAPHLTVGLDEPDDADDAARERSQSGLPSDCEIVVERKAAT